MEETMSTVFTGSFLTENKYSGEDAKFVKVTEASQAIKLGPSGESAEKAVYVVPSLNADFFLLFPSAHAIVSMVGSPLSHLAILAREHGIPVFLAKDVDFESIADEGQCTLQTQS